MARAKKNPTIVEEATPIETSAEATIETGFFDPTTGEITNPTPIETSIETPIETTHESIDGPLRAELKADLELAESQLEALERHVHSLRRQLGFTTRRNKSTNKSPCFSAWEITTYALLYKPQAVRKDIIEECVENGINIATAKTQVQRCMSTLRTRQQIQEWRESKELDMSEE